MRAGAPRGQGAKGGAPETLSAVALVIPVLATFGITEGIPGMALIQSQTGEDGVLLGPAIRSRVLLRNGTRKC